MSWPLATTKSPTFSNGTSVARSTGSAVVAAPVSACVKDDKVQLLVCVADGAEVLLGPDRFIWQVTDEPQAAVEEIENCKTVGLEQVYQNTGSGFYHDGQGGSV